jgi:signal transduction histidine kinase
MTGGPRALLAPDGKLWFATSAGTFNVDTQRPEIEPGGLPLHIESVGFNNQPPFAVQRSAPGSSPRTNAAPMRAPADLRSLDIRFTALSFTAPEKIRFRHKLEGSDVDWVDDGTARLAHYGRLPFGRYRFQVEARNADGPWQRASSNFAFIIPTPLYLQTWAIILYSILAIALVAGVARVVSHRRLRLALAQLEQQQSLERERMRIARNMHDEIGSKLTKISFLSAHVQTDAALAGPLAEKVEAIAETSRDLLQTMDEIVWVVNPRNDTLEHLVTYLDHYAVEYFQSTNVECDLRLPRSIPQHPLSSETRHNLFLAFEEALNNVLKHSGASRVGIEMTVANGEFEVKITDNGCGFEVPSLLAAGKPTRGQDGGNGLRNMLQRLADIGGECLIASHPGNGTTITLRIRPVQNGKHSP